MSAKTKLLLILGGFLFLCLAATAFLNNAAHQTQDVLADINLGKSIDLGREINDSLQLSLGIVDKLVWANIFYGVALAVVVLVFGFAIYKIARGLAQPRAGFGSVSMPQPYQVDHGPHYVSLGQRGTDYLMRLPDHEKEQVLVDLAEKVLVLQQSLGRRSHVKMLDTRTGKVVKWS